MSSTITFAPAAVRRPITRAWTERGNGHCSFRSLKVLSSTPTTTTSFGGAARPRIAKRASTVESSTRSNRWNPYASTVRPPTQSPIATKSAVCRRPRRRRRLIGAATAGPRLAPPRQARERPGEQEQRRCDQPRPDEPRDHLVRGIDRRGARLEARSARAARVVREAGRVLRPLRLRQRAVNQAADLVAQPVPAVPEEAGPESDGAVVPARNEHPSVGAEGHRRDQPGVVAEGLAERLAAAHVPEPHDPVRAGGGQRATVRAERDPPDLVGVPAQGLTDGPPGSRVPEPHRPVAAGGGDGRPVRAERDAVHRAGVPAKGRAERFASPDVPEPNRLL